LQANSAAGAGRREKNKRGTTVHATIDRIIDLALEEDIGTGDLTTEAAVSENVDGSARIQAKEPLVVAGTDVVRRVFERLQPDVCVSVDAADGTDVAAGQTVAVVEGRLRTLLTGERTALNFLQRLSGIATLVRSYVKELGTANVNLVDTRKTTPGWRVLEKYAVRVGGARNHRMGLYDGVLIKDNHIAACGGIRKAVERVRSRVSHLVKIEVEASRMDEVEEALSAGADVIMLDNMTLEQMRAAVGAINHRAIVEISGGVTRSELSTLADTGADLISVGALTHSARSVDLNMTIVSTTRRRA
jgi:nicotinate-nucleotide pyrophosphorylase (carboxylating)